jgi:hypothetical protein
MCLIFISRSVTACRLPVAAVLSLIVLFSKPLSAQSVGLSRPAGSVTQLKPEQQRILTRAREILTKSGRSEAEQEIRLQVVKATLTGTVIRPDDDYPEMRNPKHWTLSNDTFVVAPQSTAVEAIADLWVAHANDSVPIPRIRCFKYTSLILIQGYIQYFRATNNPAGLDAINRLIGHRAIPQGLPNAGDDVLWKRRHGSNGLLPGDQVWFDNPFFDQGGSLIYQENYQQAIREGKSPDEAAASAKAITDSLIAGEEGSNVFFLGDDKFIRGADSLARLCRDCFQPSEIASGTIHEQVFTPKVFNLARFQEHMVDDNYTAQACLRADPVGVCPADFKIERVRSPMDPANLLRLYGRSLQGKSLDSLIDAIASRNKPPRMVAAGKATIPLFDERYDWTEQQRVRRAIDAVVRTHSDEMWWKLRARIGDGRYVFTATRSGVAKNFSLGALCSNIVDARLCLGFASHLPSVPGRLPATFQPEQEYWQHETLWARERMPLYAMQAALCERAIQQWEAVQGTLPGSDGQSHVYTTAEKARYVAAMKREIDVRNQTKKAAYEEVVVPWRPAPNGWEGFDAESAKQACEEYDRNTVGAK